MSDPLQTPPARPDQPRGARSNGRPEYLYHIQQSSGAARRTESSDAASRNMLRSNIRTLAIALGAMVLVLVFAYSIPYRSWRARLHHDQVQADQLRAEHPPTEASPMRKAPDAGGPAAPDGRPESDLIEQAVLLARKGDTLLAADDLRGALDLYNQAIGLWPHLTRAQAQKARVLMRLQDYPRARVALEAAVEDDPTSAELLNDLGVLHFRSGRMELAERQFAAASECAGDFAPAYYNLSLCRMAMNQRDEAAEALNRFRVLRPGDARGFRVQALLAAIGGHFTNALELIDAAIAAAPNEAPLYVDAAATAALMGDGERAIEYLRKAGSLSSPLAVYLVYLQPAFQGLRTTDEGKAYEAVLTKEAQAARAQGIPVQSIRTSPEPLLSGSDS